MEGGRISVGESCLFASAIDIRNGDSHSIIDCRKRRSPERLGRRGDGEHVWLGVRVMVLTGSRTANSTVGAGSIVAGALPEGCIAAGMPARVVAQGVTWRGERD